MKKPLNYYCHRKVEERQDLPPNLEVIGKLGQGAFGQVFKVFDRNSSSIQVVKCNKQAHDKQLERECQVMQELSGSAGFARVKANSEPENNYMVMSLLGKSVGEIADRKGISVFDMKRIAHQLLGRLQQLHEKGYVHRDLKPQNVLLGNQRHPHRVYLVDFGLSGKYNPRVKKPRRMYQGEIGTIKYCPIASHFGKQQFPKDDLESLGYLLVHLAHKKLPWSGLPKDMDREEKYTKIRKMKEDTDLDKLCMGIGSLKKYFRLVHKLTFSEPVDYPSLFECFKTQSTQHFCYTFCQSSCPQRLKDTSKENIESQSTLELDQGTIRPIQIRQIQSPR